MGGNILELQNLSAWYSQGKNVLSGFSLQLRQNEVVGLIGLNGAGKTTFLKPCPACMRGSAVTASACMTARYLSGTRTSS